MAAMVVDDTKQEVVEVLFVDDDPTVTDLAATVLGRNEDIEVTTATDPQKGLERIESESFDCLVSDYQMPEMDGLELCQRVRSAVDVPCILFTSAQEELADRARQMGVGFVHKRGGTEQYARLAAEMRKQTQAV